MVNMGMRLEEGVRGGRLSKEKVSTSKKYGGSFSKKKEGETNVVSVGRQKTPYVRKSARPQQQHHQPDLHRAFHHGAPDHDIENCYPLKHRVQKLIKNGMVSFEDSAPNVKANSFPAHGNASVNMVDGCPGNFRVFDVRHIRQSLVEIHRTLCLISDCEHNHDGYVIYGVNPRGCVIAKTDIQNLIDEVIQYDSNKIDNRSVLLLVIRLEGPILYSFDKVVPYKYNATMIENGQEVPLPAANSVVSIVDVVKVTRSGRVFDPVPTKVVEDVVVSKKVDVPSVDLVNAPTCQYGESSGLKVKDNGNDEVLRLIKKSGFNIVEQLLQMPSNIFVLSLLMNSEAHREALQKVLEQAYVEHYFTMDQFNHIVANITSCNNLSFCDEVLREEGKIHNLALHISMNCKEDALSNVLVDTGSSLNVLPKSTLARLSYQGAPMRYNVVVVKAFDDSHKTVIKEVDLPVKIGQSEFQITFQLFVVGGEKALLVSHLSSFTYVEAEEGVGTSFQALSIANEI
ncbi:uncharacterized protein LOC127093269 [Lathyrus oleraceus]|uniref:uncharacterized protein LOC127093269 n=1 Tax=Pisum sativum TaxID=3888 RepID=UPI0021D2D74B|nr:uncharacterized protein LOC127093269 [Pisum sativum]